MSNALICDECGSAYPEIRSSYDRMRDVTVSGKPFAVRTLIYRGNVKTMIERADKTDERPITPDLCDECRTYIIQAAYTK